MSWALSISLTHWRDSRMTVDIFSLQCWGLRVCKEYRNPLAAEDIDFLKIQFTLLGVSGHSFWPMLTMAMSRSFLFSSYSSLAPLRWFTLWIYTCVMYKNLTLLTTAEIHRGLFLYLWFQRLTFFHLALCPKEMIFLLYFSQSSLLLGSFKTCLLIASEASRQAQLHPPVPRLHSWVWCSHC